MAIIESIAILIASGVALYGIDAWRREHVGKRRIDLAEEVLALFYEARDVIAAVLSPLGYAGELGSLPPRERGLNEEPWQSEALDAAHLRIGRYMMRHELFARIHALRYRFQAQNGRDAAKPFQDL